MKIELEEQDLEKIAAKVVEQIKPLLNRNVKERVEDDPIFTVESLAKYLQVSEQWVYERVQFKEIPYIKVGKFLRFKRSAIENWLEEQSVQASAPLSRPLKVAK